MHFPMQNSLTQCCVVVDCQSNIHVVARVVIGGTTKNIYSPEPCNDREPIYKFMLPSIRLPG